MGDDARRMLDIDALLEDSAFRFRVAGREYIIRDVPLALVIALQSGDLEEHEFLIKGLSGAEPVMAEGEVRIAVGVPAEVISGLGVRAQAALQLSLLSFFVPSDLIDRLNLQPRVAEMAKTGYVLSRTSAPSTE